MNNIKGSLLLYLTMLMTILITGCMSTNPKMSGGQGGGTITGSAGGQNNHNANSQLAHCNEPLGTVSVFEDRSLPWWTIYQRRVPNLGSTIPVIRLMIQQSGCFVVVERGAAMSAMQRERALMNTGETRNGSNFGKGQMVAADFTLSPSIQFAAKNTGGLSAIAGTFLGRIGSVVAGGLKQNEAATTLLLIENRSGVQVSAAVGSAKNFDFRVGGGLFGGAGFGGAGAFSNTPEGKIITASFADSYNQMVKALQNYKAQTVKGGLGKGGKLQVGGKDDQTPQAKTSSTGSSLQVKQPPTPVLVARKKHHASYRRSEEITINDFDKNALQNYYDILKTSVKFLSTIASVNTEQKQIDWWPVWSNLYLGNFESNKIELDSWPLTAKQKGWNALGNKIEKYNHLFNKYRKVIVKNKRFDKKHRLSIEHFNLITKSNFLN